MRSLFLLRHATPLAGAPGQRDFDRELAPEAQSEIRGVGRRIAAATPSPRLVLCSAARRTVQTLEQLRPHLAADVEARCERELYGADRYALVDRVAEVDDDVDAVLVVAHNPGLAVLANAIGTDGDPALRDSMARRYPPAALAIVRLPIDHWSEIGRARGELVDFWAP